MTDVRLGDVSDEFGSGGSNLSPSGGSGSPSARDVMRQLLGRTARYADSTALTASLARDRADGQVAVKLDDYTKWTWKAGSSTAASSTVIQPTDVGSGAGRFVREDAIEGTTSAGDVQHTTIDIPLATIQAKTSGTPFNIGSALPAGAMLTASSINVIQTVTGGTISAAVATVQNTSETAGAVQASKSVFAATGRFNTAGSNPYQVRGGQQLQMTLTATGDTLANATTGHIAVELTYVVPNLV